MSNDFSGFELDDFQMELMSLDGKRYHCSQILIILALRLMGKDENIDLIRAAGGLTVGLGHSNETCGALLGGACLLGLYGSKGHDGEEEAEWLRLATRRLVEWFRESYSVDARDPLIEGQKSIRCADFLACHGFKHCGVLVQNVYTKALELLNEFDVDVMNPR